MTSIPILALPNFYKEFVIETNASCLRVKVVLMQEKRQISFMSEALLIKNQSKSVYKKELMVIVMVFQKRGIIFWNNILRYELTNAA